MPSPQLDDGYLKIANIIVDKLVAYHLSPSEMKCLLFIIRKTYGYNKKEDMIANSQFCEATGLDKSNVCRAIRGLTDKRLVVKNDNTRITTYGFNKHYSKWKVLSKTTTVVKNDNKLLSKMTNTKDKYTKDNKEVTKVTKKGNGILFSEFWNLYPVKTGKKPCQEKWKKRNLDKLADKIIKDVQERKLSDKKWVDGYIPNPLTYINQDRWEDEISREQNGLEPESDNERIAREKLHEARNKKTTYSKQSFT